MISARDIGIIFIACIFLSGLQGCLPQFSKKGALIRVERDDEMLRNCRLMGTVKGASRTGWSASQKTEKALNELRSRAALLGANTVFIVSRDSMFKETVITGKAYDCPLSIPE